MQEDKDHDGKGMTTVQELCVTELVAKLVEAMNDKGALGRAPECLLHAQIST